MLDCRRDREDENIGEIEEILLRLVGNQSEARKEACRGRGRGRKGPPILARYGKQPSGIGIEKEYGEEKREMQEDMRRGKTLIYLFDVGGLVSDCILSTDTEYGTASTRPIPRPAAGPHLHEPKKNAMDGPGRGTILLQISWVLVLVLVLVLVRVRVLVLVLAEIEARHTFWGGHANSRHR
jgi:hypothetical protein